ncbi:MAG: hypothetical protein AB8G96_07985 [Phycisphaerales bacterium]
MSHDSAHSSPDPDAPVSMVGNAAFEDPMPGPMWTWGIAGSLVCIALAIAVASLLYEMVDRRDSEAFYSQPIEVVEAMKEAQNARLHGEVRQERRDDMGEGTALVIPIDMAIDAMVEEYAGG